METPWAFGVYRRTHSTAPGTRRLIGRDSRRLSASGFVSRVWPLQSSMWLVLSTTFSKYRGPELAVDGELPWRWKPSSTASGATAGCRSAACSCRWCEAASASARLSRHAYGTRVVLRTPLEAALASCSMASPAGGTTSRSVRASSKSSCRRPRRKVTKSGEFCASSTEQYSQPSSVRTCSCRKCTAPGSVEPSSSSGISTAPHSMMSRASTRSLYCSAPNSRTWASLASGSKMTRSGFSAGQSFTSPGTLMCGTQ
mmetsp:Transcript_23551/g.70076  ORF Transcript_23551/g.70076 Transcript_23551/m.70076 type:complete len:256 (-) Transcript_23551:220-987(-)